MKNKLGIAVLGIGAAHAHIFAQVNKHALVELGIPIIDKVLEAVPESDLSLIDWDRGNKDYSGAPTLEVSGEISFTLEGNGAKDLKRALFSSRPKTKIITVKLSSFEGQKFARPYLFSFNIPRSVTDTKAELLKFQKFVKQAFA